MGETGEKALHFLQGHGEMETLMRSHPWERTPLGRPDQWPQSLRTVTSVCLNSRFPMLIWWGPELVMIYNDAYRPILGQKHPRALGQKGAACWPEIWDVIGPMLRSVMDSGAATWSADQLLMLVRNGFAEECYFTFSYSPIHDESGGIGGVFTAVTETTERVLHERRMDTLAHLNGILSEVRGVSDTFARAAQALAQDDRDFSVVACYLFDQGRASLQSIGGSLPDGGFRDLLDIEGPTALERAMRRAWLTGTQQQLVPAEGGHGVVALGRTTIVQPVLTTFQPQPYACLVLDLDPARPSDERLLSFVSMAASCVGTALDNVHSYETERRRAESLAELDRAKTAFFSNVSHELRTPLTLMLGPLEDLLERRADDPDAPLVQLAHRNAVRLRKLVNTLLDFSRIEAGRLQVHLEPTDLAGATMDIAALFRSSIEGAGLRFTVDCPPLSRPVMVDRDMWEKIVVNFLSNAFKYTHRGEITISLRERGDRVVLDVRDTGVGIRDEDQPRVFERFYRVGDSRGRTDEGAGIGLALVKELVHLQGGEVGLRSEIGAGTTFTVSLPAVAGDDAADTEVRPWHSSALGGLDDFTPAPAPLATAPLIPEADRSDILVADDNADMRAYIGRMLGPRYSVRFAKDGEEAKAAIAARRPDLLLCDVMMPRLGGLDLTRELRDDPATRSLPVVVLSARAGEEARLEGLDAGADDYLVKPFTARELLARVDNQLMRGKLAEMETAVQRRLMEVLEQAPVGIVVTRGPEHSYEFANAGYQRLVPGRRLVGRTVREIFPDLAGQGVFEILDHVYQTGEAFFKRSFRVELLSPETGRLEERFFDLVYQPLRGAHGRPTGVAMVAFDVSELSQAKREAEAANKAKDEFIAMLGHELRNPLAPIQTALQLMKLRSPDQMPRERAIIERQVQHMVRLVDDLLDIARITRGTIELKKAPVELWNVVMKAVEITAPLIEQRRHTLSVGVPTWGLRIVADPVRLSQVVANLLVNAAKYTPPQGRIALDAAKDGSDVLLKVSDNGMGMTQAELDTAFELFMQGQQGIDRPQGGLGLGLTIARSLTAMHGGALSAHSEGPGRGCTFTLRLPQAPIVESAQPLPGTAQLRPAAPQGKGRQVLVVDDNADAAAMLAELLSAWGYVPRIAHDGPQALEALRSGPVDIALLDIGLPVMDGYELAHAIRQRSDLRHVKLVALSGYGQESDAKKSQEAGFEEHLVKPVDVDKLVRVLH